LECGCPLPLLFRLLSKITTSYQRTEYRNSARRPLLHLRQRWHRRELKSEELARQCCWRHIAVLYIVGHTQQISPWSRQGGIGLQGGLSKPPNARTRSRVGDAHWLKHVNSNVWAARTNYVVAHPRNVNVSRCGNAVGRGIRLKACDRLRPLIDTRQIYVGEFVPVNWFGKVMAVTPDLKVW